MAYDIANGRICERKTKVRGERWLHSPQILRFKGRGSPEVSMRSVSPVRAFLNGSPNDSGSLRGCLLESRYMTAIQMRATSTVIFRFVLGLNGVYGYFRT